VKRPHAISYQLFGPFILTVAIILSCSISETRRRKSPLCPIPFYFTQIWRCFLCTRSLKLGLLRANIQYSRSGCHTVKYTKCLNSVPVIQNLRYSSLRNICTLSQNETVFQHPWCGFQNIFSNCMLSCIGLQLLMVLSLLVVI